MQNPKATNFTLCGNIASWSLSLFAKVAMGYQIRCINCSALKWYIVQEEMLQNIKEMKVRASWSPFCERSVDGTLHYAIM